MAESEILWIIGDEFPEHPYLAETATKAISEPYPAVLWRINDKKIYHQILQEISANSEPYPKALWRIENGSLTHELLPEFIFLGAFENAEKLRKIVIPESVRKIGKRSFLGTALKSVKIASDCEYSESSFPDGCKVEFYSD